MKFLIPLLAAAAVTQAATPVHRQSTPSASVRAAIQLVIDDAAALQSQVEGLNGADQVPGVQDAINKLQSDIDAGAQLFTTLPALSDTDALGLASLVGPLQDGTSDAVDAVIAKKDVIVNLCVGPIAYQTFQNLIPSAQAFGANLKALVSATYQPVVQSASDNIQASLQRGLSAFADAQTLPDSCTSSTTTSPTTSPTSSITTETSSTDTSTTTTTTTTTVSSETSTTTDTSTTPPGCPSPTTSSSDSSSSTTDTPTSSTYTTPPPTTTTYTPPASTYAPPTTSNGGYYQRRHPRQL